MVRKKENCTGKAKKIAKLNKKKKKKKKIEQNREREREREKTWQKIKEGNDTFKYIHI